MGSRRARIEQSRRRVREVLLAHQLVRLDRGIYITPVNADRNPHNHVLGPFRDLAVAAHQITTFEGLEAEVVVLKVAVVDDRPVDLVLVRPAAGVA